MKRWSMTGIVLAIATVVASVHGAGTVGAQALRVGGVAPDLGGGPWINSDPLTMSGLRGRVVLVEFWTHG